MGFLVKVAALSVLVALPSLAKNSGPTRSEVDTIIVHAIGGPKCDKKAKINFTGADGDAKHWKEEFNRDTKLSIHYVVDREGKREGSVPENQIANHAKGYNKRSIGIELVNKGDGQEEYPEAQINALVNLIKEIRTRWNIPIGNIKRHSDVDTREFKCGDKWVKAKVDPGDKLDWTALLRQLDESGSGWPSPPTNLRIVAICEAASGQQEIGVANYDRLPQPPFQN